MKIVLLSTCYRCTRPSPRVRSVNPGYGTVLHPAEPFTLAVILIFLMVREPTYIAGRRTQGCLEKRDEKRLREHDAEAAQARYERNKRAGNYLR